MAFELSSLKRPAEKKRLQAQNTVALFDRRESVIAKRRLSFAFSKAASLSNTTSLQNSLGAVSKETEENNKKLQKKVAFAMD